MSQRVWIVPGPSSQVQLSQKRMRQPSEIGVSVKASVLAEQLAIAEAMLEFIEPTLLAQKASKLAPPSPSRLPLRGSPVPSPCSLLAHSVTPFQIASSRPVYPG